MFMVAVSTYTCIDLVIGAHPERGSDAIMSYIVEVVGAAIGSITPVEPSPVAGDQLYDKPVDPVTCIWKDWPLQMEVSGVTICAVGVSKMFTSTLSPIDPQLNGE